MNHPEELTLEFRKTITIGKAENALHYEKVELREPTAGDLEKAMRADTHIGSVITLVHLIGKIPRLAAEKMSARDLNRASAFFAGFNDGPETAADGPN